MSHAASAPQQSVRPSYCKDVGLRFTVLSRLSFRAASTWLMADGLRTLRHHFPAPAGTDRTRICFMVLCPYIRPGPRGETTTHSPTGLADESGKGSHGSKHKIPFPAVILSTSAHVRSSKQNASFEPCEAFRFDGAICRHSSLEPSPTPPWPGRRLPSRTFHSTTSTTVRYRSACSHCGMNERRWRRLHCIELGKRARG